MFNNMQPKSAYDIMSTNSNINAYNRYPFADLAEAMHNAKLKQLQPGEMAVCYYFDPETVIGINAILAIGNLRKGGNLIFENIAPQMDKFRDDISKDISETHRAINNNLDIINFTNKVISELREEIKELRTQLNNGVTTKTTWVNLDNYNLDLK